jgi:hemoglobin
MTSKTSRAAACTLALLAGIAAAHAQAPAKPDGLNLPKASYTPPRAADDSLYKAFGGQSGLEKLMDDFVTRLLADARMKPFFKDTDLPEFKQSLVAQFCEVAGGPCRREGPDMKKAHDGFDIRKSDFNALVEILQTSMDAQGIAFGAQNRMLAVLAPMHRDIINTP